MRNTVIRFLVLSALVTAAACSDRTTSSEAAPSAGGAPATSSTPGPAASSAAPVTAAVGTADARSGGTTSPPDPAGGTAPPPVDLVVTSGRPYNDTGTYDEYVPSRGASSGPVLVVFPDPGRPAGDHRELAVALATRGSRVMVFSLRSTHAALDSGCALRLAAVASGAGTLEDMVVIGLGSGALAATGEALRGPWVDEASSVGCREQGPASEPVALVVVAGDSDPFGTTAGAPPGILDPFSQLGANPYLRVRLLGGEDRPTTQAFAAALETAAYDVQLRAAPAADDDELLADLIVESIGAGR